MWNCSTYVNIRNWEQIKRYAENIVIYLSSFQRRFWITKVDIGDIIFFVVSKAVSFGLQKRLNLSSLDSCHKDYNRVLLNYHIQELAFSGFRVSQKVSRSRIVRFWVSHQHDHQYQRHCRIFEGAITKAVRRQH